MGQNMRVFSTFDCMMYRRVGDVHRSFCPKHGVLQEQASTASGCQAADPSLAALPRRRAGCSARSGGGAPAQPGGPHPQEFAKV